MLKRPDDWQIAYLRAYAAEQARPARKRAAWARAIAIGTVVGLLASAVCLTTGCGL